MLINASEKRKMCNACFCPFSPKRIFNSYPRLLFKIIKAAHFVLSMRPDDFQN